MKKIIILICTLLLSACTAAPNNELISQIKTTEFTPDVDAAEVDTTMIQGVWNHLESTKVVLKEENSVYSPLSTYLALSMLLPATQDSTRDELLSQLYSTENFESFEKWVTPLIKKFNVLEDEYANLVTNSVWLSSDRDDYDNEILKKLSEVYLTSSHSVDFKDRENTKKTIKAFIDQQTGGFLKDIDFELNQDTQVALINTLYFKDHWTTEFVEIGKIPFENDEVEGILSTIENPFYSKTDNYEMVLKNYDKGSKMLFIKPTEDVNTFMDKIDLSSLYNEINQLKPLQEAEVELRMPALIDISSSHPNLKDILRESGYSDLMSDNPNLTFIEGRNEMMFISDIIQNARIKVDSKGTEAAAVTIIEIAPTSAEPMQKEIIRLDLDKPYLMILLSTDNIPLFITKVINPN